MLVSISGLNNKIGYGKTLTKSVQEDITLSLARLYQSLPMIGASIKHIQNKVRTTYDNSDLQWIISHKHGSPPSHTYIVCIVAASQWTGCSLDSLLFVSHILFPLPWSTIGCGCHGWTSVARMLSRASVSRVSNFRIVFGTIRLIIE